MKIDKRLSALVLTARQSYFASCWFNMVHQHSLDSYRVRAMNPRNVLREVSNILDRSSAIEISEVCAEAFEVLNRDSILRKHPFSIPAQQVCRLISPDAPIRKQKDQSKADVPLLRYFIAELQNLVEQHYVRSSLDRLDELLIPGAPHNLAAALGGAVRTEAVAPEVVEDAFEELHNVVGNLLSVLIDCKASLESLYTVYAEVLVPRRPKENYSFERRFRLACKILTNPESDHQIVLALDNVSEPTKFPEEIGHVKFTVTPPIAVADSRSDSRTEQVRRYLAPMNRRLFASMIIRSRDPRAAGASAADEVNDILNLVRFEYERAKVSMPDSFAFVQAREGSVEPRVFSLPTVVPNPSSAMDSDGLAAFVKSVNELVLDERFKRDGRDRVQSAFRLYRTGLDSGVLENKLVNWWTALEYLVRDGVSSANGGIGKTVEGRLTPVLCNSYVAKHVHALRMVLLDMGVTIDDPATGETIAMKGMSVSGLFSLYKREEIQTAVLSAVQGNVFVAQQFGSFFRAVKNPQALSERNKAHEQRLRWHLQRLWRARCNIVHSGERVVNAALLCANLEYYLKGTLMALLKALREVETLSGPQEFFDRQEYAYKALQKDLSEGSDAELLRMLPA